MTPLKRRVAAVGAPLLLAVSLTACGGGGSSAPDDTSKADFCKAYNDEGVLDGLDPEAKPEDQAKDLTAALKDYYKNLEDVGTPKDIPDDAREGFEIAVNAIDDIDEDKIQKAIEDQDADALDSEISKDDQDKAQKFDDWASDYCG